MYLGNLAHHFIFDSLLTFRVSSTGFFNFMPAAIAAVLGCSPVGESGERDKRYRRELDPLVWALR